MKENATVSGVSTRVAQIDGGQSVGLTGLVTKSPGSPFPLPRRAVPTAHATLYRASEILYWKITAVYHIGDSTADSGNRAQ